MADLRLSDLTESLSPTASGLVEVSMPTPSGYESRKVTIENLGSAIASPIMPSKEVLTDTYTIQSPDFNNLMIDMPASGVKTLYLPEDSSYDVGDNEILYINNATPSPSGVVKIISPSGIYLNDVNGGRCKITKQFGVCSLRKIQQNEWQIYGDNESIYGNIDSNVLAKWEAEDTTDDTSGNGYNATTSVGIAYDLGYNNTGKGFTFPGSYNHYVKYHYSQINDAFNGSFSLSFFFNSNYPINSGQEVLFDKPYTSHVSPYYSFNVRQGNGVLYARMYRSDTFAEYLTVISPGGIINQYAWHHCVVIYNSETDELSMYIDKELIGTAGSPTGTYFSNDTPLCIGTFGNLTSSNTYAYNGKIDNVILYNTVIDQFLIDSIYQNYN